MKPFYCAKIVSHDGGSDYLAGYVHGIKHLTGEPEVTLVMRPRSHLHLLHDQLTVLAHGHRKQDAVNDTISELRQVARAHKKSDSPHGYLTVVKDSTDRPILTIHAKPKKHFRSVEFDIRYVSPSGDVYAVEPIKQVTVRKDLAGDINRNARENAIRILLDDNELSKTLCPELRSDLVKALNEHFNKKQPKKVESAINSQLICENAVRVLLGDNALTSALGSELQSEITKVLVQYIGDKQLKVNVELNKEAGVMANGAAKDLLSKVDDSVMALAEYNFGVSEPGMANTMQTLYEHCPADYMVHKRLCFSTNLFDFPPADAPAGMKFNHSATGVAVKTLLRDVRECRWDRIIRNVLLIADRTNSGAQWLGSTVGFEDQGPFAVFWIDQLHRQCYARIIIGEVMYTINPKV